ncbi:SsrA-binding protein SmpB [Candidatus Nomurabacteria bacterium]|nr:SsrA-binding protein SmpB [Candidatus Nomurabacteria bacterium]MCB9819357.1 SsrA-binding protein SmpB [Candidatus Nomurabacteria bacterium]
MSDLIRNKKVGFNFELLERYEAGVELLGTEVKSLRNGQGKLEGSHIIVRGDEAYLVGASIPAFQKANAPKDYEPERVRRLLLKKKEILELFTESEKRGLTVVPVRWYNKDSKLKLEIAVGRGKKKYDKREAIKGRDTKRSIERILKGE